MAHTNQTPNYELSQFLGTDKPAWLVDYNGDMEKIDLGLKDAKDVADAAKAEADQGALDIAAVTVTANSADAKASGAISDLADVYDSTSTYNVGDYVIYNNILYKCVVDIIVPESFDGNHWARTTIEEIVTALNTGLSTKQSKITTTHHTYAISARTTYSSTDIVLNIPANTVALIHANAVYANHAPTRVGLVIGNNTYAVGEYDSVAQICAVDAMILAENNTSVTIYAQYAAAGSEQVTYYLTLIPLT